MAGPIAEGHFMGLQARGLRNRNMRDEKEYGYMDEDRQHILGNRQRENTLGDIGVQQALEQNKYFKGLLANKYKRDDLELQREALEYGLQKIRYVQTPEQYDKLIQELDSKYGKTGLPSSKDILANNPNFGEAIKRMTETAEQMAIRMRADAGAYGSGSSDRQGMRYGQPVADSRLYFKTWQDKGEIPKDITYEEYAQFIEPYINDPNVGGRRQAIDAYVQYKRGIGAQQQTGIPVGNQPVLSPQATPSGGGIPFNGLSPTQPQPFTGIPTGAAQSPTPDYLPYQNPLPQSVGNIQTPTPTPEQTRPSVSPTPTPYRADRPMEQKRTGIEGKGTSSKPYIDDGTITEFKEGKFYMKNGILYLYKNGKMIEYST